MKQITAAAAVIVNSQGQIFATQRGHGDFAGQWEFPGGKVEPSETPQQAVVREIAEELKTTIQVEKLLTVVDYQYPTFHLTMHCFLCHLGGGAPTLTEHTAAQWLQPHQLDTLCWLPADKAVVALLKKMYDPRGVS